MKKSKIPILILISVIILILSISMLLSGCGRRARIARALQEQGSENVEEQSTEEEITIEETTESKETVDVTTEESVEESMEEADESEEEVVEEEVEEEESVEEESVEEETEIQEFIMVNHIAVPLTEDGWEDYFGNFTAYVGDDRRNRQSKGILSFGLNDDFEALFGVDVVEVRAVIPNLQRLNIPAFGNQLDVYACHYIDFIHSCTNKKSFNINPELSGLDYTDDSLTQVMQYVLDNDIPQFHLIFEFQVPTDDDGRRDGYKIERSDDNYLVIRYME